jgi:DNA-binding XRE family transcriptional regulator
VKRTKAKSHSEVMRPLLEDPRFTKGYEKELEKLRVVDTLIKLREKQGLTQLELARRIGVSQPFIANIESGESRNFSLETLIRLAIALGSELEVRFRPLTA